MKVAALDLGSNTFLLLIAETSAQKITKIYRDEYEVTRLGQGVHEHRKFQPVALQRVDECFRRFKKIIDEESVEKIVAVATSAARDVKNRDEFFAIGKKWGIPIQVISGDLEAELTYFGSASDFEHLGKISVVDVGGGSTEIIGRQEKNIVGYSLDIGSVRLTEMFGDSIGPMEKYIEQRFSEQKSSLPVNTDNILVAVAGTPTTLAAVDQEIPFSVERVHGYHLKKERIKIWRDRMLKMTLPERQAIVGMDPKRADVFVAGATILFKTCELLGQNEMLVSTKGVRFGAAALWEKLK